MIGKFVDAVNEVNICAGAESVFDDGAGSNIQITSQSASAMWSDFVLGVWVGFTAALLGPNYCDDIISISIYI